MRHSNAAQPLLNASPTVSIACPQPPLSASLTPLKEDASKAFPRLGFLLEKHRLPNVYTLLDSDLPLFLTLVQRVVMPEYERLVAWRDAEARSLHILEGIFDDIRKNVPRAALSLVADASVMREIDGADLHKLVRYVCFFCEVASVIV